VYLYSRSLSVSLTHVVCVPLLPVCCLRSKLLNQAAWPMRFLSHHLTQCSAHTRPHTHTHTTPPTHTHTHTPTHTHTHTHTHTRTDTHTYPSPIHHSITRDL